MFKIKSITPPLILISFCIGIFYSNILFLSDQEDYKSSLLTKINSLKSHIKTLKERLSNEGFYFDKKDNSLHLFKRLSNEKISVELQIKPYIEEYYQNKSIKEESFRNIYSYYKNKNNYRNKDFIDTISNNKYYPILIKDILLFDYQPNFNFLNLVESDVKDNPKNKKFQNEYLELIEEYLNDLNFILFHRNNALDLKFLLEHYSISNDKAKDIKNRLISQTNERYKQENKIKSLIHKVFPYRGRLMGYDLKKIEKDEKDIKKGINIEENNPILKALSLTHGRRLIGYDVKKIEKDEKDEKDITKGIEENNTKHYHYLLKAFPHYYNYKPISIDYEKDITKSIDSGKEANKLPSIDDID